MSRLFNTVASSILAVTVSFIISGCYQDIPSDDLFAQSITPSVPFEFTLDATLGDFESEDLEVTDEGGTKASAMTVVRLSWAAGDRISVVNLTTGKALGGSLTANSSGSTTTFSGTLSGTVHNGDKVAFIYPSQDYSHEQDFTPINVDFSNQTGTSKDGVPLCVYSTVTASGNTFSSVSANFTFLMSYLQLSITDVEKSANISRVTFENVGSGLTLALNGESITATPIVGSITLTPASSYKTSANGTKAMYMSMAASPAVSGRKVTVETTNTTRATDWVGAKLNQNTSYTTILAGFVNDGFPKMDQEVYVLQEGIQGLDLVILGDGFIQEDINNGTYDAIMNQAYDEFFGIEPFTTLKNDFSVYYVVAVSNTRVNATNTGLNGAIDNPESDTKFKASFTENSTAITGDHNKAREYAQLAFTSNASERIKNATIVVMVNQACHAGTCYNSYNSSSTLDYGQSCSVSYCALGADPSDRVAIMRHEINGHGFGKLADEYYYNTPTIDIKYQELDNFHRIGIYRNVDKYVDDYLFKQLSEKYPITTNSNVYWSDMFGTSNHYEDSSVESLGIYEGAYTYSWGYCRPTADEDRSIMNTDGPFNAVSRRAIYYRYLRLSGQVTSNQYGTATELSRFLSWDASIISRIQETTASAVKGSKVERRDYKPLTSPVYEDGRWTNDGRFISN